MKVISKGGGIIKNYMKTTNKQQSQLAIAMSIIMIIDILKLYRLNYIQCQLQLDKTT